jgi:hypothetical protein
VWDFPAAAATSLEFSYTWYSEYQCNKIVWATKINVTVKNEKGKSQLLKWKLGRNYNHAKSTEMQFPKFENPHHIPPTSLTTDAT